MATELHARHRSRHTKRVLDATENLHQIYQHMYRNFDAEAVATLSARVAWDCSKLEQEANREDKLAWTMNQAYELGNPRGYWEYSDEDFVGLISKLALRKGGPATPRTCAQGVLDRYRALLSLGDI